MAGTASTPSTPSDPTPPPKRVRLSIRDLVIVLIGIAAGVGTTQLLLGAGVPFGQALVAGFASFAAVFTFLDRIIE